MALSKERRPLQKVNGTAKWSVQGMTKAVEEVKVQRSGLRAAAKMYGVPVTSLKWRVETLDFHLRLGIECVDDIPDDYYCDQYL